MHNLKTGQFFGTTNETILLDGLTLTDTEYTHPKVDWHYHENPYFTFILQGNVIEGNKTETFNCAAGTLLFHNWHEAHYNIKPAGFTRGFHIELSPAWFDLFDIGIDKLQGNINISDPAIKTLMYTIFRESKCAGNTASLAIDTLLIELFGRLTDVQAVSHKTKPAWVSHLKELLDDDQEDLKLPGLAHRLSIHPVHLSRDFSKYFNCNLGHYVRSVRLQRALALLPDENLSLTAIALRCQFADQSHFIRCFKAVYHVTPSQYRNFLLKKH